MSDGPKKLSELPVVNSVANTDLFLVLASNVTSVIHGSKLLASASGPYANDSVTNTANVSVGQFYYDTSGVIHIRLT